MPKLYLTDYAYWQLADIEDYSLEHYPATTEKFMAEIEKAINNLRENPSLGSIYDNHSARYSLYQTPRHFLVHEIIDGDIFVVSIEEQTRDLINNLADLEPLFDKHISALKKQLAAEKSDKTTPKGKPAK